MKKIMKYLLICILVLLYIGESLYIGIKIKSIVSESYNTYGENNSYSDNVSDTIFRELCYRNGYPISSYNNNDTKEINSLSFPLTTHWIFGGISTYWYTYEIYDNTGELMGGSSNIPVTITFEIQQGKLKIIDCYEAP